MSSWFDLNGLPYDIKRYGILPLLDSVSKMVLRKALLNEEYKNYLDIEEHIFILGYGLKFTQYWWNLNLLDKNFLCNYASQIGSLEILQWAVQQGCRLGDDIMMYSTHSGNLEILEWLLERIPYHIDASLIAAERGYLHLLKWIKNKGLPLHKRLGFSAVKIGNLEMLEWSIDQDLYVDNICAFAAMEGHFEIVKWLIARGYPWGDTCEYTAIYGHLRILQWAVEHGATMNEKVSSTAALNGHLEFLQWIVEHGCPMDELTCINAAANGHLHVLQWARANGCEWDGRVCYKAAKSRNFEVAKWAIKNGCPLDAFVYKSICKIKNADDDFDKWVTEYITKDRYPELSPFIV